MRCVRFQLTHLIYLEEYKITCFAYSSYSSSLTVISPILLFLRLHKLYVAL